MGDEERGFSDLEDISLFGEWRIIRSSTKTGKLEIVVDLADREIEVKGVINETLYPTLLEIVSGTYAPSPPSFFGKCTPGRRQKVKFLTDNLKGPKYWSNSCNIDSVLAILAYSTGISWRGLMMLSEITNPSESKMDILRELHSPRGACSVTRNILRDLPFSKLQKRGVWKMRRAGEIYDLITDIFPELKIPITEESDKTRSTMRSSIALEDFIDGTIQPNDLINQTHLVFENNLVYEDLESSEQEEDKPEKVDYLEPLILGEEYELCGIVFHEGVSAIEGGLEDIHARSRLGSHYYSKMKLPDGQWYYYNDLEGGRLVQEDLDGLSSRDGDPGVLYFYQRVNPLKRKKMVVRSDVSIDISIDFANTVVEYSNLASTVEYVGLPGEDKTKFIRVTFDDANKRADFEKLLRS